MLQDEVEEHCSTGIILIEGFIFPILENDMDNSIITWTYISKSTYQLVITCMLLILIF
jgi:hypothetical protein